MKEGLIDRVTPNVKFAKAKQGTKIKYSVFNYLSSADIRRPSSPFGVLALEYRCLLASSPEQGELKSVPLDAGENNLVKASVEEELGTTHLNEVWDYL